jgi:SAM-dependent methyltransferase
MKKEHSENVYDKKADLEVSWYEETPTTSLNLIQKHSSNLDILIIDVGGGNSNLTHNLLQLGFHNLTVLDISSKALSRTKAKIENSYPSVNWMVTDITKFMNNTNYDIWHDRAVFHFLTTTEERNNYLKQAKKAIPTKGLLILSTFSKKGPLKCSGLDVNQYNKESLHDFFGNDFELIESFEEDHTTPFKTQQILFIQFGEKHSSSQSTLTPDLHQFFFHCTPTKSYLFFSINNNKTGKSIKSVSKANSNVRLMNKPV